MTGAAKYAGEFNVPNLAHGVVVTASIAKGRIKHINAEDALAVAGVLDVLTHDNRGKLASSDDKYKDEVAPEGSPFRPLYDDQVHFNGQPIALVVAEEFEIARFAASLIRVDYEQDAHVTDFEAQRQRYGGREAPQARPRPAARPTRAFDEAAVRVDAAYSMPVEHHNPMEPYAATAVWEGDDRITIYDKTQGRAEQPQLRRQRLRAMKPDKVRVVSPYVGGAFGSGLRPNYRAAARGDGGARAQALGAGHAHAPADVHDRLSRRERPGVHARRRSRRHLALVPA